MKKSEIKELDKLWAKTVKDLAGWTCEHCGVRGVRMEAAHVVGRRYRATRWGLFTGDLCGHCLCHNCHQQYDEHGPLEDSIVEKTVGRDRKVNIQRIAVQTIAKNQDYDSIYDTLVHIGETNGK